MDAPPSYDDPSKQPPVGAYPQPPAAGPAVYPPSGAGYPPPATAYPPPGGAYPPAGGAYPPPGGAYPPPGGAYPPQGYPPQAAAYVPTTTQPGAVVVQQVAQPRPPDNLVLGVLACICCNGWCLGLVALIFACQSQSSANQNQMEDARRKGELAKKFAIAAIIISIISYILIIVFRVIVPLSVGPSYGPHG